MSESLQLFEAGRSTRGWHRIEKGIRCLRLFGLTEDREENAAAQAAVDAFNEGVNTPEALMRGTMLHQALAHLYLQKQDADNKEPKRWLDPVPSMHAFAEKQMVPELYAQFIEPITAVLEAYDMRWSAADAAFEVVAVEHQLETVISDASGQRAHQYTQRADLIVRMLRGPDKGKIFIYDHKSAYRIASNTLNQYILDGQFIGYQLLGYRRWGTDFGGVIINRMRIPKDEKDMAAIYDKTQWRYFFARDLVPVSPAAIRSLQITIDYYETQIAKLKKAGIPRTEWPGALSGEICWGKFGQCPKWHTCHGR